MSTALPFRSIAWLRPCLLAAVLAVSAQTAEAQEEAPAPEASAAKRGRVIEEIVVTAQRTEQRLHDVPISMSAFDAEFLRQQGITDLQDVGQYTPNVRIDLAGNLIAPRIRGFSTLTIVSRSLDQPVGLSVDEVPYGRQEYFRMGLFDVDRVEVLRGPQGQLFGANSTVGLINLVTKNPTDELTGSLDVELGELNRRRFEGAIGGPVVRGFLNVRVAGVTEERDGYVENTTAKIVPSADKVMGGRDRKALRFKADLPDLFGARLLLSYQRDELAFGATPRELTSVPVKFRSLLRAYDPNVDFEPGNLVGSIDTPSFGEVHIDTFVARGHYDLAGWGLNTVAGWSGLNSSINEDSDSCPWPALPKTLVDEASGQTTFELRVTSPEVAGLFGIGKLLGLSLGSTDFTSGFFFQRRTQSPTTGTIFLDGPLLGAIAALNNAPDVEQPPTTKLPPKPEFFITRTEERSNRFAGFGQMNWRLADRWALIGGMRLDYSKKDGSGSRTDGPPGLFVPVIIAPYDKKSSISELHYAPKIGLKFDWTEDANFYVTWSQNFQAGAFDWNAATTPNVNPATVRSWEAGTKTRLLDGAAELNLGLFWMNMTDFQLFSTVPSQQTGGLSVARLINVGKLRARGVEADASWLPTNWLTLRAALGFNDTKFLDFKVGTCETDRQNTDGDSDPRCDLTGRQLPGAPKWDINMTPIVRVPLTSIPGFGGISPASLLAKIDLTSALTVQYVDTHYLRDTLDARERQPRSFLFNGNIGFGNASQGWSLQVRGENLTDERTWATSGEAAPAAGLIFKSPNPPRLLFGALHWQF